MREVSQSVIERQIVPGDTGVDRIGRLPVEGGHGDRPRGMGDSPETLRGQFQTAQLVYDLITQLIISDGTDDDAPGSQLVGMKGKIRRGASEECACGHDVPQDFTETDDARWIK